MSIFQSPSFLRAEACGGCLVMSLAILRISRESNKRERERERERERRHWLFEINYKTRQDEQSQYFLYRLIFARWRGNIRCTYN